MLKRFVPLEIPNGIITTFNLPSTYLGGDITLFVNGQLLATRNDITHPFGYVLDEINKTFTFYIPPISGDSLYIIYDDTGESTGGGTGSGALGAGVIRFKPGYALWSYAGAIKAMWSTEAGTVIYPEDVLANVQNLIISQIEDRYGVPASEIFREIQTYRDDTGQFRLFVPGSTSKVWTANGEHVLNPDLYREAYSNELGDPDLGNNVYYNPGNFILTNTSLDSENLVKSNDLENPISDLPMGQRSGIHTFIYNTPALDKTGGLLEIYF